MKHQIYRALSVLLALALAVALPLPALTEADASQDESWYYTIVQDHVPTVVSMGDSYSSGEGARRYFSQDEPIEDRVRDQDWLAHRGETAWSGLLTFRDENGRTVPLNTMRYDKESSNGKPDDNARWFFVASSGAVTSDFLNKQGKAYSVRVFKTPKEAGNGAQYMTLNELQEYYAGSDGQAGLLDTAKMLANQAFQATILEDNVKGWDGKNLREEELIDPQMDIFSNLPGGGDSVEYVTLTLGGNDLGFAEIVATAVADFFQDATQASWELLEEYAEREVEDLEALGEDDYQALQLARMAAVSSALVESNGALAQKLNDSLDKFKMETKDVLECTYDDIHNRAKNAVILVAGYPQLLDGASSTAFFSKGDIALINAKVAEFNDLLAGLIEQCRDLDKIPIYFVPVDGEGAFKGRGAYSKNPLITPVLLKATRQIEAVLEVKEAYEFATDPVKTIYETALKELGFDVLEALMSPEEREKSRARKARLREFLMLDDVEWPGYDQELVTVMERDDAISMSKRAAMKGVFESLSKGFRFSDLKKSIKSLVADMGSQSLGALLATSSASIHPTVEGHQVYAKCVQEYIETRVPIEVTGLVRQADENLELSPVPSGSTLVLKLVDGPVSEGSERLADLKEDDEVYKGAIKGEYIAKVANDGSFSIKALSGDYTLEVFDKDGNAIPLYGKDGDTSVRVQLMHHNSKDLDVRVVTMQEISGRVFAVDEDGNKMEIDCELYPVQLTFVNQGVKNTRDGHRTSDGKVVDGQASGEASPVGSVTLDSIPKKGAEYKLRVPVGITEISLWSPLTGAKLPLYDIEGGVMQLNVTAQKPVKQDVTLKVENVLLIGRVSARDGNGFARDYDLSQYPLELEISQGKKKQTWSTESVSVRDTSFSMEMVPGEYTVRLAGKYKKAGYTLSDAKDDTLTLTLPLGKPTTHELNVTVSDQKLSGTLYACTRDGDRVECSFTEDNPLRLRFIDANDLEVGSWETVSIGKRGTAYSLMLPPGTYTVAAAMKDGSEMALHSADETPVTVTVPLGTSTKSDISLEVKNQDYLGTWSNEITVAGFMGITAGIKLSLNIEESKITFKMAETSDMSSLSGLGIGDMPGSDGNEETYEGTWSETDEGIAMDLSDGKLYFTRLNDDQLYLDLDRLERDAAAHGSSNAYLLELLRMVSYMDVGSMAGLLGGFDMEFGYSMNEMMGVDSVDDIFVFTREK